MSGGGAAPVRAGGRLAVLDLMRLLGSLGVVVVHVSAMPVATVAVDNAGWWLANLANAGSRWGNALIIMAAGAILLGRPSAQQPFAFVRGRFMRLLPAVLFWSAFYLLLRWRTVGLPSGGEIAIELLRGVPYYHIWFLYMMLGMYLVIPLLNALLACPDRRLHYYLLALCAVLTAAEGLMRVVLDMSHASFLALFPFYLVYLLGGYLLFRDRPRIAAGWLLAVAALCVLIEAGGVALLHPHFGDMVFKLMYTNRGPLVMLLTFSLFLFILERLEHEPVWLLRWHRYGGEAMTKVTLGIYALHPFWIDLLARHGIGPLYGKAQTSLLALPLTVAAVFALSVLSALLMGKLPLLRRLVV